MTEIRSAIFYTPLLLFAPVFGWPIKLGPCDTDSNGRQRVIGCSSHFAQSTQTFNHSCKKEKKDEAWKRLNKDWLPEK